MKPTTFQYVITWGIVFTILLAVLVAIPLMVYFYLSKEGIDGWDKNDSDKEKIKRTSNRGTVISIFLTLMSLVQAVLKGSGAAETPLLLLFGFIFASVIGYIGDQGFGLDDGYSFNDIVKGVREGYDANGRIVSFTIEKTTDTSADIAVDDELKFQNSDNDASFKVLANNKLIMTNPGKDLSIEEKTLFKKDNTNNTFTTETKYKIKITKVSKSVSSNTKAPLFAQQVGTVIKFIMGKLLKGDFWRYIVTVFLDMFISMPIQIIITILLAPTIDTMNLVSLSMGPFMRRLTQLLTFNFDNVLQSFVAFITFMAYTNDTRFRWAYPGEVADRGSLISTGTIKLATAVAAGFYLTSVVSTDNVTNTGLKPGSSLVDNLSSKFIYVLFIISLMTIGSSMLNFMDSFSESKYYAEMSNEYTKDSFWESGTEKDPERNNDIKKNVTYNIYKRNDFKDKFDIVDDYWKGILVFTIYLLLGFSMPFLPVKFIYGDKLSNASWFKFTMSIVVVMTFVVIIFLFTLASPDTEDLKESENQWYIDRNVRKNTTYTYT
tara:strand:+ start:1357 stop:2997 length:1641 start_codon:yes stop_codon:yes gene_type:complete